jgi:hypothetical protein
MAHRFLRRFCKKRHVWRICVRFKKGKNPWYWIPMNLRSLTNEALLSETKTCVAREREMTLTVLHHLREVERRRLFAVLSYSSLFDYTTRELGYDSASAMRRIDAMRLLKEMPEVEKKIQEGTLTLSTAARAHGFFKKEAVEPAKKTTREAEKTLLQFSQAPAMHLFHERIKPVTPELSEVCFYANEELLGQLEKLKGLLAHSHPNMNTGELIAYLARLGLERLDPAAWKAKVREKKTVTAQNESARHHHGEAEKEAENPQPALQPDDL